MQSNKTDLGKIMPIFLNVLENTNFLNYSFIFIHHLSVTNKPYLEEWIKRTNTIALISIPYSEVMAVRKSLSKITNVISPKRINSIPNVIFNVVKKHPKKNIVLVEVGGYSSKILHKMSNVKLCIEDTYQGHWLHQKNLRISHPVVSIANTEAKKVENRYIGQTIVTNIEQLLKKRGISILNKKIHIAVLGYGGIGESVCLSLRDKGIIPYVYDLNTFKTARAVADGYKIANRDLLLQSSDVIIGCSGKNSLSDKDIVLLKPNSYLFSGSSKQIEFQDLIKHLEKKPKSIEIQTLKFINKIINIGYFGQPINFLDINDIKMFDVPFSLQLECFNYFRDYNLKNKLYSLPKRYQERILVNFIHNNYTIPKYNH